MSCFTHIDTDGHPVMVDVSHKKKTDREAQAEGWVLMPENVQRAVSDGATSKGDVLKIAEIAGISATKKTPDIIPLCHPIGLDHAALTCSLHPGKGVYIQCTVKAGDVTGVEMEALTGVSVAALTVYDMCKAIDKGIEISGVRLLQKSGGKSGTWKAKTEFTGGKSKSSFRKDKMSIRAGVLTVSDKGSIGQREDTSGPALTGMLSSAGAIVEVTSIVPDEEKIIAETLREWSDDLRLQLVIVTGGTGISQRDVTPEAISSISEKEIPGLGEYMRMKTSVFTERAILSRSVAVTRAKTLIVAMPGSKKAVTQCFNVVIPVLRHAVETLCGWSHDCGDHSK